jgi:hypothetical protein
MNETSETQFQNYQPVNLYTNLISQIDHCIKLSLKGNSEEAQRSLNSAFSEWDNFQAFESYLAHKRIVEEEFDFTHLLRILSKNKRSDFLRALAAQGMRGQLVKCLNFSNLDLIEDDAQSVYFSIINPALTRYGLAYFYELLIYLRENGIAKINGLQHILTSETIIELPLEEKKRIILNLIGLEFDVFKRRTDKDKENSTIQKISLADLDDDGWIDLLGSHEWAPGIIKYIESLKARNYQRAIDILTDDIYSLAVAREWSYRLITSEIVSQVGPTPILNLLKSISEARISDSYKFVYRAAWELVKINMISEATELIESQKFQFDEYNQSDKIPAWYKIGTTNRSSNLHILREHQFTSYQEIRASLFVLKKLDLGDRYQRYILEFFNSTYPSLYGRDYSNDLRESEFRTRLKTGIDFYFEMNFAVSILDPDYWKSLYQKCNEKGVLDQRHLITGFQLATELEDLSFRNWLVSHYPFELTSSTYFLSAQVDFELRVGDYDAIENLVLEWVKSGYELREQELIGIARKTNGMYLERLEDTFNLLNDYAIQIPGKAITSMVERLCSRSNEVTALRLIKKFAPVVGPDIAYSELQLVMLYIRQDRFDEANVLAKGILSRDIGLDLKTHIERLFSNQNHPSVSDIVDALKFQFKATDRSRREVVYRSRTDSVTRSRDIVRELKTIYDDVCQFCRIPLDTPLGRISEAAHIQGLGFPHNGPDVIGNLICLCPNHHKLFDASGFYINQNLELISTMSGENLGVLFISREHQLMPECIQYQRGYAIAAATKKVRKWS